MAFWDCQKSNREILDISDLYCIIVLLYVLGTKQVENVSAGENITRSNTINDMDTNASVIVVNSGVNTPTTTTAIDKPRTNSPGMLVIVISTAGGLLALCIVIICIVGILVRIKYKMKQNTKSHGLSKVRFSSIFNR